MGFVIHADLTFGRVSFSWSMPSLEGSKMKVPSFQPIIFLDAQPKCAQLCLLTVIRKSTNCHLPLSSSSWNAIIIIVCLSMSILIFSSESLVNPIDLYRWCFILIHIDAIKKDKMSHLSMVHFYIHWGRSFGYNIEWQKLQMWSYDYTTMIEFYMQILRGLPSLSHQCKLLCRTLSYLARIISLISLL